MATTAHPIPAPLGLGRVGLDQPQPNRFPHAGSWPATCRSRGDVLMDGWRQDRVEPTAARTSCPVYLEVAA